MHTLAHLTDPEIRAALLNRISVAHLGSIVEELGLLRGEFRIDVARLSSSLLEGFEIKSGKDRLDRLPKQSQAYGRIFDRITLVAAPKHVDTSMNLLPHWWGIWSVRRIGLEVLFDEIRPASNNPFVDPATLLHLLWKDEALKVFSALDPAARTSGVTRKHLCDRILSLAPAEHVRKCVVETLSARTPWRFATPPVLMRLDPQPV